MLKKYIKVCMEKNQNNMEKNVYLISDTHLNHKLLVKPRGFATMEDMNTHIITCWNNTVKKDDIVIFVGDLAFGPKPNDWKNKLNGNIIFVKGNHDKNSLTRVMSITYRHEGVDYFICHEPNDAANTKIKNIIHGHIHKVGGTRAKEFNPVTGKRYFNVNCEFLNYKPVLINQIKGGIKERNN